MFHIHKHIKKSHGASRKKQKQKTYGANLKIR